MEVDELRLVLGEFDEQDFLVRGLAGKYREELGFFLPAPVVIEILRKENAASAKRGSDAA